MPKKTVNNARSPTTSEHTCIDVGVGDSIKIPTFNISFPDLSPKALADLSVYFSALSSIAQQLKYPKILSDFLCAFADSMKAATQ